MAVAVQLAHHFQEAGITEKAIRYLHQAGDRAIRLSAYQEGGVHLTKALALLLAQPDPVNEEQRTARAEKELALQISLGIASKGSGPDPVGEKALTRARELCRQTGRTAQLCQVLGELSVFPYVRAEHRRARELMEEALALAGHINDPMLERVRRVRERVRPAARGVRRTSRSTWRAPLSRWPSRSVVQHR